MRQWIMAPVPHGVPIPPAPADPVTALVIAAALLTVVVGSVLVWQWLDERRACRRFPDDVERFLYRVTERDQP
jgi:hypothetical protein